MPSSKSIIPAEDGYQSLLEKISKHYTTGQLRAHQAVNTHLTATYWLIGYDIVEFGNEEKSEPTTVRPS